MIKVSVIIPVYNVEKYLPACLDSVLSQTLREIEVICIDDASPDHSGEILDEYAALDQRVQVLHLPENFMQGYGRNRGIEMAKGKYIYFLDSDDMITATALEELYNLAEQDALDGIFFDSQVMYESEEMKRHGSSYICMRKGNYPDAVLPGGELLDHFTRENEWLVFVQREFWRREYLIDNHIVFPVRTEHEDEQFSFEAILLAKKIRYIQKDYFIHRYREQSVMTRKPHPKDFHGYFTVFYNMTEFVERHGLASKGIDHCLLHMYECMLNFYNVFAEHAKPEDWFTPEEQGRYRLFREIRRCQRLSDERYWKIWAPLKPYKEIWIYGAGRVASSVQSRLRGAGFPVTEFVVTDMKGNATQMAGLPVREIAEIHEQHPDCAIVVAMAKELHSGPAAILDRKGFHYFLYAQNVLTGPYGEQESDK